MELIFRICLFIAGVIKFLPSILAFLPKKIGNSYGIEVLNANYELLLRHRAVLFGIVGGIMIYSALTKENYPLAVCVGFISFVSFIILVQFVNGDINPELKRVLKIDIIGLIILLIGFVVYKFK